MTHRIDENEKAAKELLELERKVRHEEALIALANEREWARSHPLIETRKPQTRYFTNENDQEVRS
jgi:hypothetical protein